MRASSSSIENGLARAGAEHDDRHIRVPGAQVAADLPAVRAGQHQVQQHQIPALAVDGGHRTAAVSLALQAVARAFEVRPQGLGNGIVVFDQQQAFVHR
jgi:hypothetical protein